MRTVTTQAEMARAVLAEEVAAAEVRALREAADAEEARCTGDWNGTLCDTCKTFAKRLRARADRLAATQEPS